MSQIRIGEKLGSFRLESVVGSGAMGVVYRGVNDANGKPAAIKVVSGEISQRSKVYERFMREAEILKQFRHPNIVRFLAVGRFQGTSYIAMEFIQGETLDKILEKRGPLPWKEVVDLAIQICEALNYAHEHGVVHRDLKPSNLMVNDQGRIKLTDFGIAKDLDATALTATGRTLGTAAYMAPEQIRGTPAVSHKTDLYALGILLYQLLVGRVPFEGSSPMILMHNHLNEKPPRPSDKVEEIPVVLDELVVNLMAKDPAARPWDAAAVAHTLSELMARVDSGRPVKMVWGHDGDAAVHPQRLGTMTPSRGAGYEPDSREKRGSRTGKGRDKDRAASSRSGEKADEGSWLLSRAGLETIGLVAALLLVGGVMGYLVWPPGAEYLYEHAKTLMESPERRNWTNARDEYIEPLDRRFPNHKYRAETRAWLDKILLDEAESRSKYITSDAKTPFNEPKSDAERKYVITASVASKASEHHNDVEAMHQWQLLEESLKADDSEERGWHLLAHKKASDLDKKMKVRREIVLRQLELAEEAYKQGRSDAAVKIRAKLVDEYGQKTDLADLFQGDHALQVPPASPSSTPKNQGDATEGAPPASKPNIPPTSSEKAPSPATETAKDTPPPPKY